MFVILFWKKKKQIYVSEVCIDNDKYEKKALKLCYNQKDIIKLLRMNIEICLAAYTIFFGCSNPHTNKFNFLRFQITIGPLF